MNDDGATLKRMKITIRGHIPPLYNTTKLWLVQIAPSTYDECTKFRGTTAQVENCSSIETKKKKIVYTEKEGKNQTSRANSEEWWMPDTTKYKSLRTYSQGEGPGRGV